MDVAGYLHSGIIELYVLGLASAGEGAEVERLALIHPEVEEEIRSVTEALVKHSSAGPKINPDVRALLMATIDYTERLKKGGLPSQPPLLTEHSTENDFLDWLQRDDMFYDEGYGDTCLKIIGHTPQAMTGIVWLKKGSPPEVHDREYEKFLVLEGTCDIITAEKTYSLVPGSFFAVPLHLEHSVVVTSVNPCKIILQREAA